MLPDRKTRLALGGAISDLVWYIDHNRGPVEKTGTVLDLSGNDNSGALESNLLMGPEGLQTATLDVNQILTVAGTGLALSSPATFCWWQKAASSQITSTVSIPICINNGSNPFVTTGNVFGIRCGTFTGGLTNEQVVIFLVVGGAYTVYGWETTRNLTNAWHHYIFTANGSAWGLYVDGQAVSLTASSAHPNAKHGEFCESIAGSITYQGAWERSDTTLTKLMLFRSVLDATTANALYHAQRHLFGV